MTKLSSYTRRLFIFGMVLIALGVTLTATLKKETGAIGTVMVGIGGLFFIAAMANKRKEDQVEK